MNGKFEKCHHPHRGPALNEKESLHESSGIRTLKVVEAAQGSLLRAPVLVRIDSLSGLHSQAALERQEESALRNSNRRASELRNEAHGRCESATPTLCQNYYRREIVLKLLDPTKRLR